MINFFWPNVIKYLFLALDSLLNLSSPIFAWWDSTLYSLWLCSCTGWFKSLLYYAQANLYLMLDTCPFFHNPLNHYQSIPVQSTFYTTQYNIDFWASSFYFVIFICIKQTIYIIWLIFVKPQSPQGIDTENVNFTHYVLTFFKNSSKVNFII